MSASEYQDYEIACYNNTLQLAAAHVMWLKQGNKKHMGMLYWKCKNRTHHRMQCSVFFFIKKHDTQTLLYHVFQEKQTTSY